MPLAAAALRRACAHCVLARPAYLLVAHAAAPARFLRQCGTHTQSLPPRPQRCRSSPERIAKAIARAGLCSRRDAERWIAEGRVAVDGEILTSPAVTVTADSDIRVDGKKLPEPERPRLWRYHKPVGLVTTHRDEKGRPTVFGAVPAGLPRLISVGRLDLNSEGLLLLTNDGALARRLELPATGWVRRYRVRVHGAVDPARLAALARGITIDGVAYGPIRAALDRTQGSNAWLTLSLQEGKNREVRRVLEHLGLSGDAADPGRLRPVPARPSGARRDRGGAGEGIARAARRLVRGSRSAERGPAARRRLPPARGRPQGLRMPQRTRIPCGREFPSGASVPSAFYNQTQRYSAVSGRFSGAAIREIGEREQRNLRGRTANSYCQACRSAASPSAGPVMSAFAAVFDCCKYAFF